MYYYEGFPANPTQAQAEGFIDDITAREKANHAAIVTFVRGRLWSQVGSPGSNEMIAQKNLSGTGALATTASMDRERAILLRRRAGNDSRGNPVYLRKWFHFCCGGGGFTVSAGHLENTSAISQADRDSTVSRNTNMNTLGPIGNQGTICAKSGRQPGVGTVWECHAFLEHHQLGDQWRAQ